MDGLELLFGSLFTFVFAETFLLILVLLKTPAFKFLKASLTHRPILIHPRENHYVEFVTPKTYSSLAYVKNRGYYLINPDHVYIEGKSKVPCAIVFGNFALSLDLKMAKIAEKLRALGLRYWDELKKLKDQLSKSGKSLKITILGESVDLKDAVDYFNTSERSDFIEAEIHRRTAALVMKKLRTPGDIFRWAVILVIILIGAAIAYAIVVSVAAPSAPSPAKIIQQTARRVITPNTTQGVMIK